MTAPVSSLDPAGTAQTAYHYAANPHVQTAVWAIVLAIVCALVLIVAEIVKERHGAPHRERNDRDQPQ